MRHPASYRDPSGYVFEQAGTVYRYVDERYAPHYGQLLATGLYQRLVSEGLLIPHEEVPVLPGIEGAHRILKPAPVAPWTYPCEWSFEQLKAAALATIEINRAALASGLLLKDATPYNIQFVGGKAVLIDTLSFEIHEEGMPWVAFRQFCTGFLYPLLLAHYLHPFSLGLLAAQPDGFSAAATAALLPRRARWNVSNRLYVYLPASLEGKAPTETGKKSTVSKASIRNNLDHLHRRISGLQSPGSQTDWARYYRETILSETYLRNKEALVDAWLDAVRPATVLDLGCNTGAFSMLATARGATVTAVDADAACIDRLFGETRNGASGTLTALVADLTHPLAGGGWGGTEWKPLLERLSGHQTVFALALVHHLALTKNVPLPFIAALLHRLCTRNAVVEWIPKDDPKAKELLRYRADIFDTYTEAHFEEALAPYFIVARKEPVAGSDRLLYFLQRR